MNAASFREQLALNLTGFVLLGIGVLTLWWGEHAHYVMLSKCGDGLVGASLLAFQTHRPANNR